MNIREVINRKSDMLKSAGFYEKEILNNVSKVERFKAAPPHNCYTIYGSNGNHCTYDFHDRRFV